MCASDVTILSVPSIGLSVGILFSYIIIRHVCSVCVCVCVWKLSCLLFSILCLIILSTGANLSVGINNNYSDYPFVCKFNVTKLVLSYRLVD